MDARAALLRAALHGTAADNAEQGLAALGLGPDAHAALAALVAEGLLREPLRLPPGALHCRWVLETTPAGRQAAASLPGA